MGRTLGEGTVACGPVPAGALIVAVEVVALLASPQHAYEGRPGDGPRPDPQPPGRAVIEIRAGLGVVGDRYSGRPAHRRAAVSIQSVEALAAAASELGIPPVDPLLPRRNIVVRGFAVCALAAPPRGVGRRFRLDTGEGAVCFQAHRPANPCRWMDEVIAPGAFRALHGRGGVRCEPLSDSVLRLGPAVLTVQEPG